MYIQKIIYLTFLLSIFIVTIILGGSKDSKAIDNIQGGQPSSKPFRGSIKNEYPKPSSEPFKGKIEGEAANQPSLIPFKSSIKSEALRPSSEPFKSKIEVR